MGSLIDAVTLSRKRVTVGQSVRVRVKASDPVADVMINGVYGATQFVQFRTTGTYNVVITAMRGEQVDQAAERITVVAPAPEAIPIPIIWASSDRFRPRTIAFSIPDADADLEVIEYAWSFGDGTGGISEAGAIEHDYTASLARDALYTTFDVQVQTRSSRGALSTGRRTISVFNTYALNKIRRGVLTPRVGVEHPQFIPWLFAMPAEVICSFTVSNLEDEDVLFTGEMHEWLRADQADLASSDVAETGPLFETRATAVLTLGSRAVAPDLRVPAQSTITVTRPFPQEAFTGSVFGVAVHLEGHGTCSQMPASASAYIEVKLPMQWSSYVSRSSSVSAVASVVAATSSVLTLQDISEPLRRAAVAERLSTPAAPLASAPPALGAGAGGRALPARGAEFGPAPRVPLDVLGLSFRQELSGLISPELVMLDTQDPVVGAECDPDNIPDNLPDGMVCQLTSELEWRYVPGRVLNAKKGDLLLDPGGPGLIGQLLRQVTPPQFYSHCGIMSKNHIEVRHSTGSDDWLKDHTAGSFLGHKGTDGFDPTALKYVWPGTVTQSIDNAYYGEWITSPDTGPYRISDFSFAPDLSNSSTIIYPVVVKPPPFEETATVRRILHRIACAALAISAHYRFYCYTRPEMALGPEGIAGADAGWAAGTVATQCASFIWLAAQHAGVRLEGPGPITKVSDLEVTDVLSGAAVDGTTLDGLYLYSAAERQAAANWLYQTVFDIAYNEAGFWGQLFTGAPDDVANQLCNAFASDWTALGNGGAGDSDAWKSTGAANAVSPDNLIHWDSPGAGNQGQFRSVYGGVEELFYLPGTYAQVPVYRWKLVPTKGTLTGTVTANADVSGANVSLLGSGQQDVVVGSDGRFEFAEVPAGSYSVLAGLNIGGYWNSASVQVTVDAGGTTDVTITLQPPPEINRLVTITVEMETDWSSAFAHSPHYFTDTKSVKVQPFHSHGHLDFGGGDTPRGGLGFDIDLNADLSITASWSAREVDDEDESSINGGATVAKNASLGWSGLRVANPDPIDNDETTMSFTIHNDQG